jgi:hypothetical protein
VTLAAGAIMWALALPAAALAASRGGRHTSSERTFAAAVYTLGGIICHQRPERTFHLGSIPLPVCARCTGIYAGAAIAGAIAFVLTRSARSHDPGTSLNLKVRSEKLENAGKRAQFLLTSYFSLPSSELLDSARARRLLALAALPALATLLFEWLSGQAPSNEVRGLSGMMLGAAAAWVVMRLE